MKEVEYFTWILPPSVWNKKPYPSRWKMTAEEATGYGAISRVDGSREVRLQGETPEEEAELQRRMLTNAWQSKGPKTLE